MNLAKLFFIVLSMGAISCFTSKENISPISSFVLTIEDEEALQFLKEKYKEKGLIYLNKLENSESQYVWNYTGSRSKLIQLKKDLSKELSITDVSNLILKN